MSIAHRHPAYRLMQGLWHPLSFYRIKMLEFISIVENYLVK